MESEKRVSFQCSFIPHCIPIEHSVSFGNTVNSRNGFIPITASPSPSRFRCASASAVSSTTNSIETNPITADSTSLSFSPSESRKLWVDSLTSIVSEEDKEELVRKYEMPGSKVESWRHTKMDALLKMRFGNKELEKLSTDEISNQLRAVFDEDKADDEFRVVLESGVLNKELNSGVETMFREHGIYVGDLKSASKEIQESAMNVIQDRTSHPPDSDQFFGSIHDAIQKQIQVIYVPQNIKTSVPLHLISVATSAASTSAVASAPSIIVILEPNSSLSLVESHISLDPSSVPSSAASDESGVFVRSRSLCSVGSDSTLNHALSSDLRAAVPCVHLGSASVKVHAQGTYKATTLSINSSLSRWDVRVDLDGSGAHGEIHGLSVGDMGRVSDLHSSINHNVPQCTSDQLQKNVALSKGSAVFSGKIFVERDASGSDSAQLCRSLLLSSDARIDAMPILDINNDDVKATHGATIADLSEEQVFYLQSRGLAEDTAKFMLLTSFGAEILARIPILTARVRVEKDLSQIVSRVQIRERSYREYSSI
mmetsp:Transcript_7264/g.13108  ORF Transcript_7264/g.13108 Transcript_7264/m.13108 type:complete len:541 (-) Transcript_7264:1104-2726(-)